MIVTRKRNAQTRTDPTIATVAVDLSATDAPRVCARVLRIASTAIVLARPNTNACAIWVGRVNRAPFRVDAIIIQRAPMDREIVICVTTGRRESTANAVELAAMEMLLQCKVACHAIAMATAIRH